ncbi:MAG: hypothetical protein WA896_21030 [Spirulinaceae cyanobacterium]
MLSTLLLLPLSFGCTNQPAEQELNSHRYTIAELDRREQLLWRRVMQPLLSDPLWQERNAYDAGHYLMLPLHGAFASEYQPWIDDFDHFFERFTKNYAQSNFDSMNTLTRLHFLYLVVVYT